MERIISKLETKPEAKVLIDLRTEDGSPNFDIPAFKQKPILLAISLPGGKPSLIETAGAHEKAIPLIRYLEGRTLIGHDLQTKLSILTHYFGFKLKPGNAECVMAASQILHMGNSEKESELRPDIYLCYHRAFGKPLDSAQKLSWKGELTQTHYQQVCRHLALLPALHESLTKSIFAEDLDAVWHLETHILPALIEMQIVGLGVDRERLQLQWEQANQQRVKARAFLDTEVDPKFNPNSPEKTRDLLNERGLKLPNIKDVTLRDSKDPVAEAIYEFRVAHRKLKALNRVFESIDKDDGRAHCIFDPLWAETGRIQTRNFNAQGVKGVPPDAPEAVLAQEMRTCFRAAPGKIHIHWDFKNEELRILAYITQDPKMIAAIRNGDDLHITTAAGIFRKAIAAVTPEERKKAKRVNFGIPYGIGADGLAEQLGIPVQEAQEIIDEYYNYYEGIRAHRKACWDLAWGDATEVRTGIQRRRLLPKPKSDDDRWKRFSAYFNGRIQAAAADALKIALEWLHGSLPPGCTLVLTAHDSIMIECPDDKSIAMEVIQLVEGKMLEAMNCLCPDFPFEVETKIGYNWAEMVSPDKLWAVKS